MNAIAVDSYSIARGVWDAIRAEALACDPYEGGGAVLLDGLRVRDFVPIPNAAADPRGEYVPARRPPPGWTVLHTHPHGYVLAPSRGDLDAQRHDGYPGGELIYGVDQDALVVVRRAGRRYVLDFVAVEEWRHVRRPTRRGR